VCAYRGSRIWDGEWRKERAEAYGIDSGVELEEFYRKRSLLYQARSFRSAPGPGR
jgi:hypothetical protein